MPTSAIAAADRAFTLLSCEPSPLAFDARGISGLPDHPIDLLDLRRRLTSRTTSGVQKVTEATTDEVWRRLGAAARSWGPAWRVAAVGLAAPGLTRMAARLSRGRAQAADDIDAELVAGFLEAITTMDLQAPRVWVRLMWAAWRCGERAGAVRQELDIPLNLSTGSSTPKPPYGHPELVLVKAVAAGIISHQIASVIAETRIGGELIDDIALAQGVSPSVLRMRRRRGELKLAAALEHGDLYGPAVSTSSRPHEPTKARGITPRPAA